MDAFTGVHASPIWGTMMKNILLAVAVIFLTAVSMHAGQSVGVSQNDVTVSSVTPTLLKGITNGRKLVVIQNTGLVAMRIDTSTSVATNRGIMLEAGVIFQDNYYVLVSSWWGFSCGTNTATTAGVFEKY